MRALLFLALSVARPVPDAREPLEGQRATQCILLYRLQKPEVPTGSDACEDAGYGLEFMRERDPEIRAVEQQHAEVLAHAREESLARKAAHAARAQLEAPCRALALGTGPGPDGGEHECALAELTPTVIAGELGRERRVEQASDRRRVRNAVTLGVVLAAVAGIGLGLARRRGR